MAATFSWAQYVGSSGNSNTPSNLAIAATNGLFATSSANAMSWDFETADNTGTSSYTANPVSAGSNSWPVWLKGYFSNSVAFTVSNVKFWQFNPAASSANTASFGIFGTSQGVYAVASAVGTATGAAYASNVQVPTSSSSTGSPASPLVGFGTFGSSAGTTGVLQNYICLQLTANPSAPAGTTGYFGFTLQYDEQ